MKSFFEKIFSNRKVESQTPESQITQIGTEALETARMYEKENNDEVALQFYDIAIKTGLHSALPSRAFILQKLDYDFDAIKDFTQAIYYNREDPNLFFGRHLSKNKIGDIEGAITDIEEAILLSQIKSPLIQAYDDEIKKQGYKEIGSFYNFYLLNVKIDLEMPMSIRENRKLKIKHRI